MAGSLISGIPGESTKHTERNCVEVRTKFISCSISEEERVIRGGELTGQHRHDNSEPQILLLLLAPLFPL